MLNGATAGLGLVHALYADMRFAADDAVLTTAFARLGLASEYGMAWALRNAVGHAHALDLLLSARKVRGEEALRLGLVNRIHPREELPEATYAYARELAESCSPLSLRMIKRQLWELPFQTLHEALMADSADMMQTNLSEDFEEGKLAFKEKRKPRFKGR
jgi:enoyl-CoA hydratase/carnithine racemase